MFIKFSVQQLLQNNYHIGASKTNICMQCSFFLNNLRVDIYIFNFSWIYNGFKKFLCFLKTCASDRSVFWFLARNDFLSYIIDHFSKLCGNIYLHNQSYGGHLSNASFVFRYHKFLKKIRPDPIRSYIKRRFFPSAAILLDSFECPTIPWDGNRMNLPVGALCDSDMLPTYYSYLLLGNNKSFFSNTFFCKLASFSIVVGKIKEFRKFLYKSSIKKKRKKVIKILKKK